MKAFLIFALVLAASSASALNPHLDDLKPELKAKLRLVRAQLEAEGSTAAARQANALLLAADEDDFEACEHALRGFLHTGQNDPQVRQALRSMKRIAKDDKKAAALVKEIETKAPEFARQEAEASTLGNRGALKSAVAIYYGDKEGEWPAELETLVPTYMDRIPSENITGSNRVVEAFDGRGGWVYTRENGEVEVNVEGKDSKGRAYKDYGKE